MRVSRASNWSFLALTAVVLIGTTSSLCWAVPIDSNDKRIIVDWVKTWVNFDRSFVLNESAIECEDVVRQSNPDRNSTLLCADSGRVTTISLWPWNFNGSDPEPTAGVRIPNEISNLSALFYFQASNLRLIGTIPAALFQLPSLSIIKLSANELWGTVPPVSNTNLQVIDLDNNLLSGVIPDMRGFTKLAYVRFSTNNFQCPQPYWRPSLTTTANFPSLQNATGDISTQCFLDSNILSGPDDLPGFICGENAMDYQNTSVCMFVPTVWSRQTTSNAPKYIFNRPNASIIMEVDGCKHAFFIKLPNGTRAAEASYMMDITSLSFYSSGDHMNSLKHTFFPLREYTSVWEAPSGKEWRLGAYLNGSAGYLETIWELKSAGEIKFSFYMRNWTFPSLSGHQFNLNIQSLLHSSHSEPNSPIICSLASYAEVYANLQGDFEAVNCKSSQINFTLSSHAVSLTDIEMTVKMTTKRGSSSLVMPLYYLGDGYSRLFGAVLPSYYSLPFGRMPTLAHMDEPDMPARAYQLQLAANPGSLPQHFLVGTGLQMDQFQVDALYDPTISLVAFFDGASPEAPLDPVALGVGLTFAAVAVIACIGVVTLVPRVRHAVFPFLGRREAKSLLHTPEQTDTELANHAKPANGWQNANVPRD